MIRAAIANNQTVGVYSSCIMTRALRFCGLLLLNAAVALFGSAIFETTVGKLIPAHSLNAVLWKQWTLSIMCAAFIGFGMWWRWRSSAVKWTWVLTSVWFAFRFLPAAIASGHLWFQFSGTGCGESVGPLECLNFFVFTIPFIRGIAYSLGAYVASAFYGHASASEVAV